MEKKRWIDRCPRCGLNFWLGLAFHSSPPSKFPSLRVPLKTIRHCRRCRNFFICDASKLFYPVLGALIGVVFIGVIIKLINFPIVVKLIFLGFMFISVVYALWKVLSTPCISLYDTIDKKDSSPAPK